MVQAEFVKLEGYREHEPSEMLRRAAEFADDVHRRRTVREFSKRRVPKKVIVDCIRAAGSAPSGANKQPWHFVVVSDPERKSQIRKAAEDEEHEFYTRRAPQAWLDVLQPLGTDARKPFLEMAPYLIVVFEQRYDVTPEGRKIKNYYTRESVGIATGLLIAAVHNAGLVSLTHTPSPMGFLNDILDRPGHEQPFLLLVVGYPCEDAKVPKIKRKKTKDIVTFAR